MCTMVVTPDGRWLGTANAVEAEYPQVKFTDDDAPEGHEDDPADWPHWRDSCFCAVDVESVLDRCGIAYIDNCGFLDVVADPNPKETT